MNFRLLLAGIALACAPASAEVEVSWEKGSPHLKPYWLPLSDGSQFALMAAPHLNSMIVLRCWDHADGTLCVRASEFWAGNILITAVEWEETDAAPAITIPLIDGKACSRVLDKTTSDLSLPNCARLLDMVRDGGLLAIARAEVTELAPRLENLPSSILRRAQDRP